MTHVILTNLRFLDGQRGEGASSSGGKLKPLHLDPHSFENLALPLSRNMMIVVFLVFNFLRC